MSSNRIGQAPLFPESANQHFTAELLNHFGNGARNTRRVAAIAIRVENEHPFISVSGQSDTPRGGCCTAGCKTPWLKMGSIELVHRTLNAVARPMNDGVGGLANDDVDLCTFLFAEFT